MSNAAMKGECQTKLTQKSILLFWIPLAATWLMMSIEGPFLTGIIARLSDPKQNLAAWSVTFVLAIVFESPIIMIMSASIALAKNKQSYVKLRNFVFAANVLITVIMLAAILSPSFDYVMMHLIGLSEHLTTLAHHALFLMLPWPAAIGYRRFYQGILTQNNQTKLVAFGTVIRMTSMGAAALLIYWSIDIPGASVGAAAASIGVTMEAIASRIMVRRALKTLLAKEEPDKPALTYRKILHFYMPLAATSLITIAVHPMITFFMGKSRFALESIALIPVINALVFLFRALGISFQEAAIALLGDNGEQYKPIRKFAYLLATVTTTILALIAFTPLLRIWYQDVSGLAEDLLLLALIPTCIQFFIPFLEAILSFQRAVLVKAEKTAHITLATALDVSVIVAALYIAISRSDMVGVTAAAIAMVLGRVASNAYLMIPVRQARLFFLNKSDSIITIELPELF